MKHIADPQLFERPINILVVGYATEKQHDEDIQS